MIYSLPFFSPFLRKRPARVAKVEKSKRIAFSNVYHELFQLEIVREIFDFCLVWTFEFLTSVCWVTGWQLFNFLTSWTTVERKLTI